ncbi:cholinesterase [Crepidotus variabilis]|uniref:Carboxylic ester hydrolase n=1 Tax=Crepidotus variabilis TaxID=179855 RepID=A0A9P6JN15_9AGAR|nr:cholinesterase [Crepidotus variabilis]
MILPAVVGAILALAVDFIAASPINATTVGSDFHLLFQNDLNWPAAQDHNGTIFLDTPMTHEKAVEACQKLNEGLLTTSGTHFKSDTESLVKYLEYNQQVQPTQSFWIAGENSTNCQSYSMVSGLGLGSCNTALPTFCSQSAPYRPNTNVDQNPAYQVQLQSQSITFIGNRDHLTFRFLGIPFANPVQRFAYSTPYTASSPVTLNSTSYGPACPQAGTGQEDCLFLNVYTPYIPQNAEEARRNKKLKPVMVWIYGGGFIAGEADTPQYDGGNMASRSDLVYVSINYRLGPLGFLTLNDGVTNGNFGLGDQVTALEWIQKHIAAFGGDPSRVTIYGESSGAGSVRALLSSPPAFGLFGGAISQSMPGALVLNEFDLLDVATEYKTFDVPLIKSMGCDNSTDILECLRAIPVEKISANPTLTRGVVVDGHYITGPRLGVAGNVPVAPAHVIFGWMREDGAPLAHLPASSTNQTQSLISAGISPNLAAKIVASPDLFPLSQGPNATVNLFNLTSRVLTTGVFACPNQAIVASAGKHRSFPTTYAYRFDRSYSIGHFAAFASGFCAPPKSPEFPNGDPNQPYFRCHGGELYYTAGTLGQDSVPFRDPEDLLLSQITVDAWGSFARTYNPNPSFEYLAARGYNASAEAFRKAGPWMPATLLTEAPLRLMDVPLRSVAWPDTQQCNLLGLPDTMFDG